MRLIAFFALFTILLASPAIAQFGDNFDGELNELWETRGGKWEIKDGVYHGSSFGAIPAFAVLPFRAVDGSVIEVKALVTQNGYYQNACLVFAYVNELDVFFAGPGILLQQWAILHTGKGGWNEPGWIQYAFMQDAGLTTNKWYSLIIEIKNTTVRFFENNAFKVEYNFHNGLPVGRIGIGMAGSDAMFDDMKITGEMAYSVAYKDKLSITWSKLKSGN